MSENRQHERHQISLEVQVLIEERTYVAQSRDLSIGGMRVELDDSAPMLRTGMRVEVAFRIPELPNEIRVPAAVRWTDRVDDRMGGIQFLRGLRAFEVWAIERMRRTG